MSEILSWLFEQAKTASPFVAVICLGGSIVFGRILWRVMWLRHLRDIDDVKEIARAQIRVQEEDTKAKEKLAHAIGELTSLILAKFGSGRTRPQVRSRKKQDR